MPRPPALPARLGRTLRGPTGRRLLLVALLVLPALLAACTLPAEPEPFGDALTPRHDEIPGLTGAPRSHPIALHVTPDGGTAYIALAGTIARPDHRIAVVDLGDGTLKPPLSVGKRPLALVPDPSDPDRLFVTHPYSPSISILDTARGHVARTLEAPYYLEQLALTSDGGTLVATDRAGDRLLVYTLRWDGTTPKLALASPGGIPTGPNPEHVAFVPPPAGADWHDRIVAVTDRHGASITLIDLASRATRRVDVGGAPLALAARDGLVFVAGLGPGNGTTPDIDGTPETGSADIENSLLVVDVRTGPRAVADETVPLPTLRYLSDTARPDNAIGTLRLLAGALPRALWFDDRQDPSPNSSRSSATSLWIVHHSTDQVQQLHYETPEAGAGLTAGLLVTPSGHAGARLSHLDADEPLAPGRLSDSIHGVYETPPGPRAVARHGDHLYVVAELSEELRIIDLVDCPDATAPLAPCAQHTLPLVEEPRPYPDGPFEEGERLFVSALPSADQDRSCASCHIDGLATGGVWALPHRDLYPVRIPRLDQTADNAPWLLDASATTPHAYLNATGGDLLRPDDEDPSNLAWRGRADEDPADMGHPGAAARIRHVVDTVRDPAAWMDATFAFALGETRLLPDPPRDDALSKKERKEAAQQFMGSGTACASCHGDGMTAKTLTPPQGDDIPRPPGVSRLKAPALAGIWDRAGTGFLHDARAATIPQALLPDGHACLDGAPGLPTAWHGTLDRYRCGTIEDIVAYLLTLQRDT